MNDSSRTQGGLICIGVAIVGAWFLLGLLQQSYWALAIPIAVLVFFVLGLTFWVGYTIATIQVEPEEDIEAPAPNPAASLSDPVAPAAHGTHGVAPSSDSGADSETQNPA